MPALPTGIQPLIAVDRIDRWRLIALAGLQNKLEWFEALTELHVAASICELLHPHLMIAAPAEMKSNDFACALGALIGGHHERRWAVM